MKLVFIRLMVFSNLFVIGTTLQAQEKRIMAVSVECGGECQDSKLGQLCREYFDDTFIPVAIDCSTVRNRTNPLERRCIRQGVGTNNYCFTETLAPLDPQKTIYDFCEDTDGRDAQIYCEQVTAQEGTRHLGNGHPGVNMHTIYFPQPFNSVPLVVVTTKGERHPWPDVFAITTRNVTRQSFDINVLRLDSYGDEWGQNLKIDWRAFNAGVPQPHTCGLPWFVRVTCSIGGQDNETYDCNGGTGFNGLDRCNDCLTARTNSCEERDGTASGQCGCGIY